MNVTNLLTSPSTGKKTLPVNIMLDSLAKRREAERELQKRDPHSAKPKVKNYDSFWDFIMERDMRKAGEKIELDDDGRLIVHGLTRSVDMNALVQQAHSLDSERSGDYIDVIA